MDFSESSVVIAGGSGGIGRACIQRFLDAGARVVSLERGSGVHGSYRSHERFAARQLDVRDPDMVSGVMADLASDLPGIDVLVNCIGVNRPVSLLESAWADWQDVVGVNLSGAFALVQAAGRSMVEQRSGSIVQVSSMQARTSFSRSGQYAASKAGVEALVRVAAAQFAPFGVRVNCVAPGATDTDFGRRHWSAEKRDELASMTMLGRLAGPDEIARVVVFLASDMASYLTGATVAVNGGALVH